MYINSFFFFCFRRDSLIFRRVGHVSNKETVRYVPPITDTHESNVAVKNFKCEEVTTFSQVSTQLISKYSSDNVTQPRDGETSYETTENAFEENCYKSKKQNRSPLGLKKLKKRDDKGNEVQSQSDDKQVNLIDQNINVKSRNKESLKNDAHGEKSLTKKEHPIEKLTQKTSHSTVIKSEQELSTNLQEYNTSKEDKSLESLGSNPDGPNVLAASSTPKDESQSILYNLLKKGLKMSPLKFDSQKSFRIPKVTGSNKICTSEVETANSLEDTGVLNKSYECMTMNETNVINDTLSSSVKSESSVDISVPSITDCTEGKKCRTLIRIVSVSEDEDSSDSPAASNSGPENSDTKQVEHKKISRKEQPEIYQPKFSKYSNSRYDVVPDKTSINYKMLEKIKVMNGSHRKNPSPVKCKLKVTAVMAEEESDEENSDHSKVETSNSREHYNKCNFSETHKRNQRAKKSDHISTDFGSQQSRKKNQNQETSTESHFKQHRVYRDRKRSSPSPDRRIPSPDRRIPSLCQRRSPCPRQRRRPYPRPRHNPPLHQRRSPSPPRKHCPLPPKCSPPPHGRTSFPQSGSSSPPRHHSPPPRKGNPLHHKRNPSLLRKHSPSPPLELGSYSHKHRVSLSMKRSPSPPYMPYRDWDKPQSPPSPLSDTHIERDLRYYIKKREAIRLALKRQRSPSPECSYRKTKIQREDKYRDHGRENNSHGKLSSVEHHDHPSEYEYESKREERARKLSQSPSPHNEGNCEAGDTGNVKSNVFKRVEPKDETLIQSETHEKSKGNISPICYDKLDYEYSSNESDDNSEYDSAHSMELSSNATKEQIYNKKVSCTNISRGIVATRIRIVRASISPEVDQLKVDKNSSKTKNWHEEENYENSENCTPEDILVAKQLKTDRAVSPENGLHKCRDAFQKAADFTSDNEMLQNVPEEKLVNSKAQSDEACKSNKHSLKIDPTESHKSHEPRKPSPTIEEGELISESD
jgi:hypothetical protein